MEEFEDDFNDLYADVEVQASSAMSARHELREMPPGTSVVPVDSFREGIAAKNELKSVGQNGVASSKITKSNCPAKSPGEDNDYHCEMDMDKGSVEQSRSSRPSPAQCPLSPHPEMSGCVQISDSEEDINHEFSDCDADGISETSKVTKKVNAGSNLHKVQSVEQRCKSRDSAVFLSAVTNAEREKNHMQSRKLSKSATELPKTVPRDDQHCNKSKRYGVKSKNTKESRYCERDMQSIRKELKQQQTHLSGDDVSGKFEAKAVCGIPQMKNGHMESSAMFNQGFNEMNFPYYMGSGTSLPYFQGIFPYRQFGPAYLPNHYWNTYPAFGYQVGLQNGHNINGNGYFLDRRTQMGSEFLQGDWHHNGSRHVKDVVNFKESTRLEPQTSFSDGGGHRMEHWRRKNEGDLPALGKYNDNSMKEKYRRDGPSACSDKDLDLKNDHDMPCDKRGMKSPERRKRRRDGPCDSFDSLCGLENEENKRKYIKHQSLHFNPYKEPTVHSTKLFQGAAEPKSGTPEKHVRFSREESLRGSGPHGSINPIIETSEVLEYHQHKDHFDRRNREQFPVKNRSDHGHFRSRKHHQVCQVLPEKQLGYRSRHLDHKIFRSGSIKSHRYDDHFGSRNHQPIPEILPENEEGYRSRHLDSRIFRSGSVKNDRCHDHFGSRNHQSIPEFLPENEGGYRSRHLDSRMSRSGSVKNHRDHDHSGSRNHHPISHILHGNEEESIYRHLDDETFGSGKPLYQFERILRETRTDDRDEYDVPAFLDSREEDKHAHIMKRNCDSSSQFDLNPRFVDPDSFLPRHLRYQDSVICDKKSILQSPKKAREVDDVVYHKRYDYEKLNDSWDFEEFNDFNPRTVVPEYERTLGTKQWDQDMHNNIFQDQKDEFLDIEEGEIITGEINEKAIGCMVALVDEKKSNCIENSEVTPNRSAVVERLDEQRIEEIRSKMEKRRERFREPIPSKKNPEPAAKHVPDPAVETTEGKMERPARKRRWVGS